MAVTKTDLFPTADALGGSDAPTESPAPNGPHEPLRVLIVDHDPAERRRAAQLATRAGGVVVGEYADGAAAADALDASRVDVVLLEVPRRGRTSGDALGPAGASAPEIVFCSTDPGVAVDAFDANAADYLLKPFDEARLATALGRARDRLLARRPARPASGALGGAAPAYPEALAVRCGTQFVIVRVADVDWVEADGNHARLYVGRRPRLVTKALATLERDVLDPALFVRVHRSAIVNVSRVAAAEPLPHGELTLVLRDGSEVDCSRRYRKRLESRLYFTT